MLESIMTVIENIKASVSAVSELLPGRKQAYNVCKMLGRTPEELRSMANSGCGWTELL